MQQRQRPSAACEAVIDCEAVIACEAAIACEAVIACESLAQVGRLPLLPTSSLHGQNEETAKTDCSREDSISMKTRNRTKLLCHGTVLDAPQQAISIAFAWPTVLHPYPREADNNRGMVHCSTVTHSQGAHSAAAYDT